MKKELYYKILSSVFIVSLLLLNIAPFSISANGSLTAPFVGYNWRLIDYNFENQTTYNLNCSNSTTTGTFDTQGSGTGDSISLGPITDTSGRTYYSTGATNGGVRLTGTISINSSNGCSLSNSNTLNRYSVLEVDIILDNNYVGSVDLTIYGYQKTYYVNGNIINASILLNGSYNETTNYGITINNYDLYLNNGERWDFPIESIPIIRPMLQRYSNKMVGITNYSSYFYPSFNLNSGDILYYGWVNSGKPYYFSFIIDKSILASNINTIFDISQFDNFDIIRVNDSGYQFEVYTIAFYVNSSGGKTLKANTDMYIIPIYFGYNTDILGTDFALNIGLQNTLLKNLDIIANGTQQSNNSSSQADTTNQTAEQTFQQEEQLVNNAENDLNDKLTNLDIQNQNNSLFGNSKFISSASWVKTQFDNLTNNNAFGYLITFSLVIGLSLVIIGKLRG